MADSEDLKRLQSGELDLSRCDFREAKLSGLDLRGRNFSHSLFQKAQCENTQFDGSNFESASMSFMNAANAKFDGCKLEDLHFGYTNFTGASFKKAEASKSRFQNVIFTGADLSSTVMKDGAIDADTILTDVISDKMTNFEGLKVLRPTSRNSLFKEYEFKNGKLHRITPADNEIPFSSSTDTSYQKINPVETSDENQAVIKLQKLLQNALVTRVSAQHFAGQIEDALRGVPSTQGNKLVEPLQTMLEFAEILRKLAPSTTSWTDPLDVDFLKQRISELEATVQQLTIQLSDEKKCVRPLNIWQTKMVF